MKAEELTKEEIKEKFGKCFLEAYDEDYNIWNDYHHAIAFALSDIIWCPYDYDGEGFGSWCYETAKHIAEYNNLDELQKEIEDLDEIGE